MSSFPRSPAGSPPAPANASIPNPRKRSSVGGQPSSAKRRKPSTLSTNSNHPLRQTSFPPEENASLTGARSLSVDTDIVPRSVATSVTGGKRGKKGKSAAPEGSVKSGKAGRSGRADSESKADGDEGEAEEDDDEEEGDTGLVETSFRQQAAESKRRFAMLFEAADAEQQDRLTQSRQFHLDQGRVRRIVNQTLSQSVPKSVILAINSYSKQFIGELIERALEIQRLNMMAAKGPRKAKPNGQERNGDADTSADADAESDDEREDYIGPLMPDSLREALRRMKKDGELGGAGMEGFSLGLGVPGAKSASLGGRRLFR